MNTKVLINKLLGVSVATKSRCGFLVALVAIVAVGAKEALSLFDFLRQDDVLVCIAVAMLGTLFWLAGCLRTAKAVRVNPSPDAAATPPADEHPLAFLTSLKYWGLILVLAAGLLSFFVSWSRRKPPVIARAHSLPVIVTVTNVVTITNEAPRLSWPALELQGLVFNGSRSSAVVNGRVLHLGEGLSNVVLVAVSPEGVTVSLEGQTNVLALRK